MNPRRTHSRILAGVAGIAVAAVLSVPAFAEDVTQSRLENADSEPQNWLTPFQNYSSHRYSRLDEINRDNVGDLHVAFTLPVTTGLIGRNSMELENHPLVDDGMMYYDDAGGIIFKVDVSSGDRAMVVWRADAAVSKDETSRSRGMAMFGNAVYHNLTDGRVVAVDRDSGEFLFDVQIARVEHPGGSGVNLEEESFTAAPLAADGKILVGNSAGDSGTRGWLAAVDATTGEEVWRTYSVPGPGEPGHETWADDHGAWKTGGASFWTTGSYDAGQRVTIWGAAQPVPMHDPQFRPGDNLYSNSAIAFNIDDGGIEWYFQYVPNESWDYDEQGVHILVDAPFNGTDRQQVIHWGRNGFVYQVDRTNGEFINATQFVDEVNWTAGIDPKTGKPVEYNPTLQVQEYVPEFRMMRDEAQGPVICPHRLGGVRWQPPAYNPDTHISYVGSRDGCASFENIPVIARADGGVDAAGPGGNAGINRPAIKDFGMHGLLGALDVTTGEMVARLPLHYDNESGVLATSGGLVFTATVDGTVSAHNSETLEQLWSFNTGYGIKSPVISYAVDGKQYIAILAGGNLTTAGLQADFPEIITNKIPGGALFVFAL
jgi:alcohol dehydrogenase (cytochrome c)